MRPVKILSLYRAIRFGAFRSWILTWRTVPVLSWIRAAELYRIGRYDDAVRLYKRGLQRHPKHPARYCARIDLAHCLFAGGQVEEAAQHLRHLVSRIPQSRTVHSTLFSLQLRGGQSLDAAWSARRAFRSIVPDAEFIGLFYYCVVENGGPAFLLREAERLVQSAESGSQGTPLMTAARYRRELEVKGYAPPLLKSLELLADQNGENIEIAILASESLLRNGKVASARRILRRALHSDPSHPRVLSLFAESYLLAGSFYNPPFALQLATESCKRTGWKSPREMHVLAEVYYHMGDTLSSLVIAERARDEGSRLLGTYRDSPALERLIEALHDQMSDDSPIAA